MTTNTFDTCRYHDQIRRNIDMIQNNIAALHLPKQPTLMAVTKTIDTQHVNVAIKEGISLLGENRQQELCNKYADYTLKSDHIHFIGHLQNNKVKYIIDKVSMVQSLDSQKLAATLNSYAQKAQKQLDVLIEVNISKNPNKSGIVSEHLEELMQQVSAFEHLRIKGLMCIPDIEGATAQFEAMYNLFSDMKTTKLPGVQMEILSMGMSGDYIEAIKCGSNLIRLGTAIFNRRNI